MVVSCVEDRGHFTVGTTVGTNVGTTVGTTVGTLLWVQLRVELWVQLWAHASLMPSRPIGACQKPHNRPNPSPKLPPRNTFTNCWPMPDHREEQTFAKLGPGHLLEDKAVGIYHTTLKIFHFCW